MASDPTQISDPATRTLARQLASLTRKVESLEAGQRATQLGNSSIENGSIRVNDGSGLLRLFMGKQPDGTFGLGAVNGAQPGKPNTPELTPTTNGLTVGWNGEFVNGVRPGDFSHVAAYLSPAGQSFIWGESNQVGTFTHAGVLPVSPLDNNTDFWCVLVAWNTSGIPSEPSFVVGPQRPEAVVANQILDGIVTRAKIADEAVNAAKLAVGAVGTAQLGNQVVSLAKLADGSVDASKLVDGSVTPAKVTFTAQDIGSIVTYNQPNAPTGTIATGSLWVDSDAGNKLYRWNGSMWASATDADIATALQAAQAAQTAAAQALDTATAAEDKVDGKVTVFYQNTAPTTGMATGDLWLDTANGNRLSRYNGTTWAIAADQRIATALANAATAQSTADGKITAFYQGSAPTSGMGVGDLWYNTSSGNAVSRYNGTSWVALPFGSAAVADNSIIGAKIASGAVTAGKLADGSVGAVAIVTDAVTADKIATGAVGSGELAANSVIAGKVAAGTIGATEIAANAIIAGKIAAGTIGTNELAANSVVAGKIAADSISSTHIVAAGIQAGDLAADSVAAGTIAANAISSRELQALSVIADKLAANSVTAGKIQAGSVTADKLAAILVVASQIIAGTENGARLQFGPAGLTQFTGDSLNSIAMKLGADPAGGNYLTIVDPSDPSQALASISNDGTITATSFAVSGNASLGGNDLGDWLGSFPRGTISRAYTANNSPAVPTTFGSEVGWLEVSWLQETGRLYRISTPPGVAQTGAVGMVLRIAENGATPTVNSPALCAPQVTAAGSSTQIVGFAGSENYNGLVRVLLTVQNRQTGAAGFFSVANTGNRMQMVVEDIGPLVSYTGGASTGGGGNAQPAAQVKTYPATWSQSYNTLSEGPLHQGRHPSKSTGDGSLIGFNDAQIRSDLAGATINKIELYLYCRYTYNAAGTTVVLGTHNQANPGNVPYGYATENWQPSRVLSRDRARWTMKKAQALWQQLPIALGEELRDNVCKGMVLDSSTVDSGGLGFYGAWDHADPARSEPALRITFTK